MKYGESIFDVAYLVFALVMGLLILIRGKGEASKYYGVAVLALVFGDAYHLVPRALNYFIDHDYTRDLGIGKLISSLSMTAFYMLLYLALAAIEDRIRPFEYVAACFLSVARYALCLFPQNGWADNDSPLLWSILRNIPFVALGVLVIVIYKKRCREPELKRVWLLMTLSFAFYIPVVVGAGFVPMLGMLMLPKTVCYVLIIWALWRRAKRTRLDAAKITEV